MIVCATALISVFVIGPVVAIVVFFTSTASSSATPTTTIPDPVVIPREQLDVEVNHPPTLPPSSPATRPPPPSSPQPRSPPDVPSGLFAMVVISEQGEVSVHTQQSRVLHVSLGFSSSIQNWTISPLVSGLTVTRGDSSFGVWAPMGGGVATGIVIVQISPSSDCVLECIDAKHFNTVIESIGTPAEVYTLAFASHP